MCLVKNHTEASFKESNFSPLNGSSYTSSLVSFDVTWLSFVPEIRSFDKHYYYCQRKRQKYEKENLLKWIIIDNNLFTVHANCSNYNDRVWKVLARKWCPDPFFRVVIRHFESLRGLPLYFRSQTSRSPSLVLIMPTKDVLNYSTTKYYNRFKITT